MLAISAAGRAFAACVEPGEPIAAVPWAQQMLGPDRVWPFGRGQSIRVAVLDSGVDASHKQLAGAVQAGFDAVAGSGPADTDCLGSGTQVAGVIAARPAAGTGFVGIAPSATIVPVRVVSEQGVGTPIAEPAALAAGVDSAVTTGVSVIVVSAVAYEPSDALRAAIERAERMGVIVVAAVGDLGDDNASNPTPYPAAYDTVIGVGAIGISGERWRGSQHGGYVDLVAPGADVVSSQARGGLTVVNGTGVAAGFVGATAALVRGRRGHGQQVPPSEIRRALLATAMARVGGDAYGRGVVNPYAAVTDRQAVNTPAPLPDLVRPTEESSTALARSRTVAAYGALIAGGAVLLVLLTALAVPRGRKRFWRATLARRQPHEAEATEPAPPAQLFDDPSEPQPSSRR
jgi:membrane-anchored mycosin MYCP